jgi:hypothetical protein
MEIQSLKCNHCSADLKVNPQIKFFNCNFCGSSLTIKNSGGTVYTEVIGEIKANTDNLVMQSNTILLEQELERLDREWLLEREQYMISGKNGSKSLPSQGSVPVLIVVIIIILVMWLVFAVNVNSSKFGHKPPVFVYLFPIPVIAILIWNISQQASKGNAHEMAKAKYEDKRRLLLDKIAKSKDAKVGS